MGIELPQEVCCRVTCDENPISRVALMATLQTSHKNDYYFFISPTAEFLFCRSATQASDDGLPSDPQRL